MLDISQIMKILKHRYPFLLIDRVQEVEADTKVTAIKCVTINEVFFQGHFPGQPIMPGVLIIEAMAQTAAILAGQKKDTWGYLTSIYNARFVKPVTPGDKLVLECQLIQRVKNLVKFKSTAKVNDELVAKAELGFIILESKNQKHKP